MAITPIKMECPVCRHEEMRLFYENKWAPVFCNVLWESRDAAMASPRAKISLAFCPECSLVYNVAFDPRLLEYTRKYENSLHYSARFQKYAEELARRLVQRHKLYHKNVVEIGCGQGDFLSLLARFGHNRAIGFDPSFDPARGSAAVKDSVTIVPESYSPGYASRQTDIICCRQVLEHIHDPFEFLSSIRNLIGNRYDTLVFFEVPNALYTLKDRGVWDIIYEHCSYFTAKSLARIFIRAGFDPIEVAEQYDGQFLTIEARPHIEGKKAVDKTTLQDLDTHRLIREFLQAYRKKTEDWKLLLDRLQKKNCKTVIWGAGSKGISFLNNLNISHEIIEYVVDLNPHKHGRYLTGTGQKIIPPSFLPEYSPKAVVIMNPIYQAEIRKILRSMAILAKVYVA